MDIGDIIPYAYTYWDDVTGYNVCGKMYRYPVLYTLKEKMPYEAVTFGMTELDHDYVTPYTFQSAAELTQYVCGRSACRRIELWNEYKNVWES